MVKGFFGLNSKVECKNKNSKNSINLKFKKSLIGAIAALCAASSANAAYLQEAKWERGMTLLGFFAKHNIDPKTYYNLSREDKELADEIIAGHTFYSLKNNDEILQVLIPISDDSQLHIFKKGDGYGMQAIPVAYFSEERTLILDVKKGANNDIYRHTGSRALANSFSQATRGLFITPRKNDKIAVIYDYKERFGKPFGMPSVKIAMIKNKKGEHYAVRHEDGRFYDKNGNDLTTSALMTPVVYKRISSRFSKARKHPILGYKRPHLGVDYAAPRGTKVKAAGDGRVIFAGRKGGYGKTVIVQHSNGYKTLYAHLHTINTRSGVQIKQGQQLGTVGSTGLSTGPHLHFGLYQNNVAINPERRVKFVKNVLKGKAKEEFNVAFNNFKGQINTELARYESPEREILASKEPSENTKEKQALNFEQHNNIPIIAAISEPSKSNNKAK